MTTLLGTDAYYTLSTRLLCTLSTMLSAKQRCPLHAFYCISSGIGIIFTLIYIYIYLHIYRIHIVKNLSQFPLEVGIDRVLSKLSYKVLHTCPIAVY